MYRVNFTVSVSDYNNNDSVSLTVNQVCWADSREECEARTKMDAMRMLMKTLEYGSRSINGDITISINSLQEI